MGRKKATLPQKVKEDIGTFKKMPSFTLLSFCQAMFFLSDEKNNYSDVKNALKDKLKYNPTKYSSTQINIAFDTWNELFKHLKKTDLETFSFDIQSDILKMKEYLLQIENSDVLVAKINEDWQLIKSLPSYDYFAFSNAITLFNRMNLKEKYYNKVLNKIGASSRKGHNRIQKVTITQINKAIPIWEEAIKYLKENNIKSFSFDLQKELSVLKGFIKERPDKRKGAKKDTNLMGFYLKPETIEKVKVYKDKLKDEGLSKFEIVDKIDEKINQIFQQ